MKFGDYDLNGWRFLAWVWLLPIVMIGPVRFYQVGQFAVSLGMIWVLLLWFFCSLILGIIFVQLADAFGAHSLLRLCMFGAALFLVIYLLALGFSAITGSVSGNVSGIILASAIVALLGAVHATLFYLVVLFRGTSGVRS